MPSIKSNLPSIRLSLSKEMAINYFLYATSTIVFVFLFSEILISIVKGWFTFSRSYSFLIFLISMYMIWIKKDYLQNQSINPNIVFGALITVMGCMILVVGKVSSTLVIQGLSLVLTLLGLILLLLGNQFLKILFIPVGYLALMFSVVEELLGNVSIYFQNTTALIASKLLGLIGMPVVLYQRFIELPHITLEVAKVCNGVNHIVALIALAIPLAIISNRSIWYKFAYIFLAAAIGIFANGLRVALIGIWTLYNTDMASIHGPFELFYVSFILLFGLCLIGATWLFTKNSPAEDGESESELKTPLETERKANKFQLLPGITLCAILVITTGLLYFGRATPVYLKADLSSFPKRVGQWHGQDVSDSDWPFKNHKASSKLKRIYKNDNSAYDIGLYISYFYSQSQGSEIINDQINWLYYEAKDTRLNVGSNDINIKIGRPRGLAEQTYKGDERTFYFWYQIDEKIFTGRYATKIATLLTSIFKRKSNGAMIVVTINENGISNAVANGQAINFIQNFFPIIQNYLKTV